MWGPATATISNLLGLQRCEAREQPCLDQAMHAAGRGHSSSRQAENCQYLSAVLRSFSVHQQRPVSACVLL